MSILRPERLRLAAQTFGMVASPEAKMLKMRTSVFERSLGISHFRLSRHVTDFA